MTKRRALSEAAKRSILDRWHWRCPGVGHLRLVCGRDFYCTSDAVFDHPDQLVLSKDDSIANRQPLCERCNDIKTNGIGGALRITTAGSDSGIRKKNRALTQWQKDFEERVLRKACGAKRQPTGNWPKGRKLGRRR